MDWIEIIKLLVICWGLKDLFEFIGGLISEIEIKWKRLNIIKYLISYVLSCNKCSSMWLALILSGNLFIAVLISIIINYLSKIEYKIIKNKETEL